MAALILCTEFGEYRMLFSRGYAAASMTHRGPLQGLADQLDTKGKVEEFYERGRVYKNFYYSRPGMIFFCKTEDPDKKDPCQNRKYQIRD